MTRRPLSLLALFPLVALTACPKEDHSAAHPAPSPAASSGMATGPSTLPQTSPHMDPTPKVADPAPATGGETVINYRWSGGLSIYQYETLTIRGTDTAKVTFLVK